MPTPLSAQGNSEFWETATSGYDSLDWQKKLTKQVRAFIKQQDSWLGLTSPPETEIKVLDYACGPGAVSLAILPYTTKIIGLDVNPQQVAEYNRRATGSGFPESLVHAEVVDILLPDPKDLPENFSSPDYNNFDYAFCSAALHHVDDPALGVKRLAERVSPSGGKVVIIEFLQRDLSKIAEEAGVASPAELGTEEERLRMNAEYRLKSHDNSHMKDFVKDFVGEGKHHGVYHEQHEQHGHGHHHHHHDHGEGEGGEKKMHGPHGFKVEQMEGYFKDAGLVEVKSKIYEEKLVIMGLGNFEAFVTVGERRA